MLGTLRVHAARSRRLLSWLTLGVAASLAELALLRLLYESWQWSLPLATAVAAEVFILVKFGVADRWVFGQAAPALDRAVRYHGACAGALAVYWLVINVLSAALETPYVVGFVLGTGASFAWSLATNFLWVWRRRA